MDLVKKIYVAGHKGMVGSAFVRALEICGNYEVMTIERDRLDLRNQQHVYDYLSKNKPDLVIVAAAKVGGIHPNNTFPAEFLCENIAIASNLIHGSHVANINRLLFLGSNCIYPRDCSQPISEQQFLSGRLEPTNEAYAIAKIAGIKLCEAYQRQYGRAYISVIPASLYGQNDHYDPINSHVLPALLRKVWHAKVNGEPTIEIWGSGQPRREFLHVDDLVQACLYLLRLDYQGPMINIGASKDLTIRALLDALMDVIGYQAEIIFDTSKPDGMPRKLLDSSKLYELGWQPKIPLRDGLVMTYKDFLQSVSRYNGHV
jgi:GDP-L-fucose synthase